MMKKYFSKLFMIGLFTFLSLFAVSKNAAADMVDSHEATIDLNLVQENNVPASTGNGGSTGQPTAVPNKTAVKQTTVAKAKKLMQTGEVQSFTLSLIGTLLLGGVFVYVIHNKKEADKS